MKIVIEHIKGSEKVLFKDIKDRECFYSGGTIYMKIFQQDLKAYNINNVNAISIINAGLTRFDDDEEVYKVNKTY